MLIKKNILEYKLIILILFFTFTRPSFVVLAQQAMLFLEKGSVKVIGEKGSRIFRKPGDEEEIFTNDRIQTGKDTIVKIKIIGKPEIIELAARSFFQLGKIVRQSSSVSIEIGKARFKITGKRKKRSKKKRFKIRTVTALVGVRGTDFVLGVSNSQTNLLTISGSVSFAPVKMPDVEIEVPSNQASTVQQNSTPTAPVEVTPEIKQQIIQSDSSEGFKNVKFGEAVDPEEVRKKKQQEEEQEEEQEEDQEEEKRQQTKSNDEADTDNEQNNETEPSNEGGKQQTFVEEDNPQEQQLESETPSTLERGAGEFVGDEIDTDEILLEEDLDDIVDVDVDEILDEIIDLDDIQNTLDDLEDIKHFLDLNYGVMIDITHGVILDINYD